jgi:hypothetical protein
MSLGAPAFVIDTPDSVPRHPNSVLFGYNSVPRFGAPEGVQGLLVPCTVCRLEIVITTAGR